MMKNILFLSLLDFISIKERNIYCDLLREFSKKNYNIYIISPVEKKKKQKVKIINEGNITILKPIIGNIQKVNFIEKGISTLLLENQILKCIKDNLNNVKFDLLLYTTPPITFEKVIRYVKKRDDCITYLMLKDIFPQNAVDMGSFGKNSIFYKYFRKKEIKLYKISDYIGCMSKRNMDYIKKHNDYIDSKKICLCPNSITPIEYHFDKFELREKYDLPKNSFIYMYGGNLGKPQGIGFLIDVLKRNENREDRFFLIVGSGTEKYKLDEYIAKNNPSNVRVLSYVEKNKYMELLSATDIGMIFLDYRFTIPNYPSRILSYMELDMPIIAATDVNTDIKELLEENNIGIWCYSKNVEDFNDKLSKLEKLISTNKLNSSLEILKDKFLSKTICENICNKIEWSD